MPELHHSDFTCRMPFLPPNQQRQSTEGTFDPVMYLKIIENKNSTYKQYRVDFLKCRKTLKSFVSS